MVANLSSHKRGWDERWEEFSAWAEKGKTIQNRLLDLVDEDTQSFNMLMEAYGMPKKTDEEKSTRNDAVQEATRQATLVPFNVMETAYQGFELIRAMVETGNPNSVTDAGVGAIAICTCIRGAFLNVRINAKGLKDKSFSADILHRASVIESKAKQEESAIIGLVDSIILG
jgi:glutamate formiminotransferase / formiminotetrahydrofolate cyclodeaminase